jgi:hypothetical protein
LYLKNARWRRHLDRPPPQTHTTRPGSYRLFPTLCQPTAPVTVRATTSTPDPGATLAMPRRKRTRAQDRAARVEAERRKNENDAVQGQLSDRVVAVCDRPPPFLVRF